jgi:Fur family transcriptional regulator, peroxide stress response regulator
MAAYEEIMKALKNSGFRLTPQRQAICRLLVDSEEHPSALMIYEQLHPQYESLSLATVYNTLEALTKIGLVNVLGEVSSGDAVRYDAHTHPHINLACVQCHRIIDIASPHVQELEKEVAKSSGYTLLGSRVMYYGLCPDCQRK